MTGAGDTRQRDEVREDGEAESSARGQVREEEATRLCHAQLLPQEQDQEQGEQVQDKIKYEELKKVKAKYKPGLKEQK